MGRLYVSILMAITAVLLFLLAIVIFGSMTEILQSSGEVTF